MRTITITIHTRLDNAESWQVSDDGGEFDDEDFALVEQAMEEVEARHDHYVQHPNVRVITRKI
jgi:hypothetical protein